MRTFNNHFAGKVITIVVLVVLFLGVVGFVAAPNGELDGDYIGSAPAINPDGELDGDYIGSAPAVNPDGELDGDYIGSAPAINPDGELDGDYIG